MPDTYGTLYRNNVNYSRDTAESISYDNSNSGLTATDVQAALVEIGFKIETEFGSRCRILDLHTAGVKSTYVSGTSFETSFPRAKKAIDSGKYVVRMSLAAASASSYETDDGVCAFFNRFAQTNVPVLLGRRENPRPGVLYVQSVTPTASTNDIGIRWYQYPATPAMALYVVDITML